MNNGVLFISRVIVDKFVRYNNKISGIFGSLSKAFLRESNYDKGKGNATPPAPPLLLNVPFHFVNRQLELRPKRNSAFSVSNHIFIGKYKSFLIFHQRHQEVTKSEKWKICTNKYIS